MSRQVRASTRTFLLIVVGVVVCVSTSRAQTISDRIRAAQRNPDMPVVFGRLGDPFVLTLAELVKASDLVVEANLVHVRTYANDRDTAILRDFAILPNRVLGGSVPPGAPTPGSTVGLILTIYGGTVVREGISVTAVDHATKPVTEGVRYLLFKEITAVSAPK